MFAITSKVKIAAGIAAGAFTLGAAGAYAATANNTVTVNNPTPITLGSGSNQLKLISLDGKTLTVPANGFQNPGQCVSWLAQNKNIALAPQGSTTGSVKLSKNYHGKLMSGANAWCKTQLTSAAKATDSAEAEATQSAEPETDSTDSTDSTASHGHGHAYGHSKHTAS